MAGAVTLPPGGPAAPAVRRVREPLRVLGTSVTQIEPVKRAAEEDLGIALEFITLDGGAAQRRGALRPDSFDVYDQWFHDLDLVWPTGSLQPLAVARLPHWDAVNALARTGRLEPGAPRAGGADPSRRLWVQLDGALGEAETDRVSMVPTVHNADGFAAVGELACEPAPSWAALLDPQMSGRVLLQSDPAIGALDLALALRARGELQPRDIGDLSLEEIDRLVARLAEAVAAGQFAAVWADEDEAIEAMSGGLALIGSLWWSGVVKLRADGVPVRMVTPREGCRGWFGGLALSVEASGRAEDAAYDYINWWLDGRAGAILAANGAYMAATERVRSHMAPADWAFWYAGAPAETDIRDPFGHTVYRAGEVREGGAYAQRIAQIVVWDTVMTEHNYLMRRWESALGG